MSFIYTETDPAFFADLLQTKPFASAPPPAAATPASVSHPAQMESLTLASMVDDPFSSLASIALEAPLPLPTPPPSRHPHELSVRHHPVARMTNAHLANKGRFEPVKLLSPAWKTAAPLRPKGSSRGSSAVTSGLDGTGVGVSLDDLLGLQMQLRNEYQREQQLPSHVLPITASAPMPFESVVAPVAKPSIKFPGTWNPSVSFESPLLPHSLQQLHQTHPIEHLSWLSPTPPITPPVTTTTPTSPPKSTNTTPPPHAFIQRRPSPPSKYDPWVRLPTDSTSRPLHVVASTSSTRAPPTAINRGLTVTPPTEESEAKAQSLFPPRQMPLAQPQQRQSMSVSRPLTPPSKVASPTIAEPVGNGTSRCVESFAPHHFRELQDVQMRMLEEVWRTMPALVEDAPQVGLGIKNDARLLYRQDTAPITASVELVNKFADGSAGKRKRLESAGGYPSVCEPVVSTPISPHVSTADGTDSERPAAVPKRPQRKRPARAAVCQDDGPSRTAALVESAATVVPLTPPSLSTPSSTVVSTLPQTLPSASPATPLADVQSPATAHHRPAITFLPSYRPILILPYSPLPSPLQQRTGSGCSDSSSQQGNQVANPFALIRVVAGPNHSADPSNVVISVEPTPSRDVCAALRVGGAGGNASSATSGNGHGGTGEEKRRRAVESIAWGGDALSVGDAEGTKEEVVARMGSAWEDVVLAAATSAVGSSVGKPFPSHTSLKSHLTCHTPPTLPCTLCPLLFRRNHDLVRHMRSMHDAGKPHGCKTCGLRFARADALRRHVGGGCVATGGSGSGESEGDGEASIDGGGHSGVGADGVVVGNSNNGGETEGVRTKRRRVGGNGGTASGATDNDSSEAFRRSGGGGRGGAAGDGMTAMEWQGSSVLPNVEWLGMMVNAATELRGGMDGGR
ncbi:hypothetical protein DFJ73DRAFT_140085 [Zopfochytrium polystomum]|nr:hypothetical protein DFJ73DRAFT_140085 [Zopfochytrium polystomum]